MLKKNIKWNLNVNKFSNDSEKNSWGLLTNRCYVIW
jgi:hypothetical protein